LARGRGQRPLGGAFAFFADADGFQVPAPVGAVVANRERVAASDDAASSSSHFCPLLAKRPATGDYGTRARRAPSLLSEGAAVIGTAPSSQRPRRLARRVGRAALLEPRLDELPAEVPATGQLDGARHFAAPKMLVQPVAPRLRALRLRQHVDELVKGEQPRHVT